MKHDFKHEDHHSQEHYKNPPSCGLPVDTGGPKHGLDADKAREILHDGTAHGKPITGKQRRYMGAVASGKAKRKG